MMTFEFALYSGNTQELKSKLRANNFVPGTLAQTMYLRLKFPEHDINYEFIDCADKLFWRQEGDGEGTLKTIIEQTFVNGWKPYDLHAPGYFDQLDRGTHLTFGDLYSQRNISSAAMAVQSKILQLLVPDAPLLESYATAVEKQIENGEFLEWSPLDEHAITVYHIAIAPVRMKNQSIPYNSQIISSTGPSRTILGVPNDMPTTMLSTLL
jgi:hypothetical protein